MSYCRFSSDTWKSDVYCYQAISGGFVVHIAGNRVIGDIPPTPPLTKDTIAEYTAAHEAQMAFLGECEREPIDLPHAGGSMDFDDPGSCADGLEMLRGLGYHVPQYAIDALREEAAEQNEAPAGAADNSKESKQ